MTSRVIGAEAILEAMRQAPAGMVTPGGVAHFLDAGPEAIEGALDRLWKDGQVQRKIFLGQRYYRLPQV